MPKKVYLQPEDLVRHSRHHTHYAGDGEGKTGGPLHRLEFRNGVARNVDEQTFKRFKDLGACDTKRPTRPGEEE